MNKEINQEKIFIAIDSNDYNRLIKIYGWFGKYENYPFKVKFENENAILHTKKDFVLLLQMAKIEYEVF